ncbi:hypothetical protein ACOANO_30080 [Pseudomonas aeruginosa]|nr:Cro/Cl family transcriptional regulator [Pseudomonas aeruginosa]RPP78564.1 Cro/Cl family transcriptional regulator [Pseudomonas aeruginosa]RPP95553.1 Cro/Cl family transcriptional regulator [Pseudomonas aeruginosa]RPU41632.1 Cro/Cl family transcriptional regulator [Pseudomonas aeruginosa]RQC90038.1 Cro/Cl family transcriptional regulator [Pseudomonas aeruginosa]
MKRKIKNPGVARDLHGFVVDQLSHRKGDWPVISRACGVPYFTIAKISSRTTDNPKIETVQRLANYFFDHPLAA